MSSSPMKSSRSCNDTVSVGHVIGYKKIPSSTTSSSNSSSDVSYASCSPALSSINSLAISTILVDFNPSSFSESVLLTLKNDIPAFFKKLGWVSHYFFESALLAVKVFLQTNTFHIIPKDLPQLCSLTSFFGAEVKSVFFHISGSLTVDELFNIPP
ncbi:hypothetical protein GEMRC1_013008 [Eukaryota sp. GEM-RC1]